MIFMIKVFQAKDRELNPLRRKQRCIRYYAFLCDINIVEKKSGRICVEINKALILLKP